MKNLSWSKYCITSILAIALMCISAASSAALEKQQDGTVKDTLTGIVWLMDWGSSIPSVYQTQDAWAESLIFAGSDDWHLPTFQDFQTVLAHSGGYLGWAGSLTTVFDHVSKGFYGYAYWSNTPIYVGSSTLYMFDATYGYTSYGNILPGGSVGMAVAVRYGEATLAVPEPSSILLFLVGFCAIATFYRQQKMLSGSG